MTGHGEVTARRRPYASARVAAVRSLSDVRSSYCPDVKAFSGRMYPTSSSQRPSRRRRRLSARAPYRAPTSGLIRVAPPRAPTATGTVPDGTSRCSTARLERCPFPEGSRAAAHHLWPPGRTPGCPAAGPLPAGEAGHRVLAPVQQPDGQPLYSVCYRAAREPAPHSRPPSAPCHQMQGHVGAAARRRRACLARSAEKHRSAEPRASGWQAK